MRTIQQLKDAGFTVRVATDAIDCTEVVSPQPFWYYNLRFYDSMADIHEHLQAAPAHTGGYRLLAAGLYPDDALFPFNVIDAERKAILDDARARYVTGLNDMQRAESDYMDAVRTDEDYAC